MRKRERLADKKIKGADQIKYKSQHNIDFNFNTKNGNVAEWH